MNNNENLDGLIQQPCMIEVFFDGGSVVVPEHEESIYINALSDTWIDGCRVYVENGEVKEQLSEFIIARDSMSLETSFSIIEESLRKQAALYGEL